MLLSVPRGTQLYEFDCGAKCLHLIMQYYNFDVPYTSLLSHVNGCRENGLSIGLIKSLARSYGFKARSLINCSMDILEERIRNKQPVIVLIQAWAHKNLKPNDWRNMGKGNRDYGHYAVVMGFDDDFIVLRDPNSLKQLRVRKDEFLARWHGGNDRHCAIFITR